MAERYDLQRQIELTPNSYGHVNTASYTRRWVALYRYRFRHLRGRLLLC